MTAGADIHARRRDSPAFLAAGIESEWADRLFPARLAAGAGFPAAPPPISPYRCVASPFPASAVRFLADALPPGFPNGATVLETGGGFGRFAYELLSESRGVGAYRFEEIAAPKRDFVAWLKDARRPPRAVPVLTDHQLRVARETVRPPEDAAAVLAPLIVGEPTSAGGFTLVVALNVIDQVADPPAFLAALVRRCAPGGYLLISSPLEWHAELTPPGHWRGSLLELVAPAGLRPLASAELPFVFRSRPRRLVIFASTLMLLGRG